MCAFSCLTLYTCCRFLVADKQHEDFRVMLDSFKDEELDCKVDLSDFDLPGRQER